MNREKLIAEEKMIRDQLMKEYICWLFKKIEEIIGLSMEDLMKLILILKKYGYTDDVITSGLNIYINYHLNEDED